MVSRVTECAATGPAGAAGKPALADRPPGTLAQAAEVVGLFKVLGNETALRLLLTAMGTARVRVTPGVLARQVGLRVEAGGSAAGALRILGW